MKEVRSKENSRAGKKIEKTVSLADRMKSNLSHSVEQRKEQSNSETSPNQYADSTAREGFDRITHEGGHLVISTSQDAYHMGVNLYKRHQAQKQAESQQGYVPTDMPEVNPSIVPDELISNAPEVGSSNEAPIFHETMDTATPISSVEDHFSSSRNNSRTRVEYPVELPTQGDSYEAGRQYTQKNSQENLRSVRGKTGNITSVKSASEIHAQDYEARSIRIRTKDTIEPADKVPHNTSGDVQVQSQIEAGRALAKKAALEREANNTYIVSHNSPHSNEDFSLDLPTQTASYESSKQYAQRSSQEKIRSVPGNTEDLSAAITSTETRPAEYTDQLTNIRTKENVGGMDRVMHSSSEDSPAQSSIEAGRMLAKKEAHKRDIERQKQNAHISISTEIETTKHTEVIPDKSGARKLEPTTRTGKVLTKTTNVGNSVEIKAISPQVAPASGKTAEHVAAKAARGKEITEVSNAVRSAEHAVKGTDIATKEMIRVAKNNLSKAKRAEQIRIAAKAAASAAKKTGNVLSKAAKAIAESVKELIAALAAGGGMALLVAMILVVVGAAGLMLASDENDGEVIPVSDEVKAYEPLIRQYAKQYGIGDYVLLIEAVMMQESGGRTTDPMQCSECNFNTRYPHAPGSITDPEYSIEVGIQNLADCLSIAGAEGPLDIDHIKLALQGYNYGQGYITWALNKYGEYSKANAVEFSMKTAEQVGWKRYNNGEKIPAYDGYVLAQEHKYTIQRMADAMGVNYLPLFTRLKELGLFEMRPIEEYLEQQFYRGGGQQA